MRIYNCSKCFLHFKVGHTFHMLGGGISEYSCMNCGSMHKVEHGEVVDSFYGMTSPLFEKMDEIIVSYRTNLAWQKIIDFPVSKVDQPLHINSLVRRIKKFLDSKPNCLSCGVEGQLVSLELPVDSSGNWPVFDNECFSCKSSTLEHIYTCSS